MIRFDPHACAKAIEDAGTEINDAYRKFLRTRRGPRPSSVVPHAYAIRRIAMGLLALRDWGPEVDRRTMRACRNKKGDG